MARNTSAGLLNVTRDTPSRGVAHRLGTRSMRQSPTQQRRRGNGVVRAWAIARHRQLATALAADTATPLAILGGLALWLLRLAVAPASTLAGFRAWVLAECPVAPGRRAPAHRPAPAPPPRKATKTARFLALATERHGSLASVPLDAVAGLSADLAPRVGLHPGTARAALRKAVLAARNGAPR
jgi:hypothetical protein